LASLNLQAFLLDKGSGEVSWAERDAGLPPPQLHYPFVSALGKDAKRFQEYQGGDL